MWDVDVVPFPVTVIGVRVVEARAARTGVAAASATEERAAAASRPATVFCFIFEGERRVSQTNGPRKNRSINQSISELINQLINSTAGEKNGGGRKEVRK